MGVMPELVVALTSAPLLMSSCNSCVFPVLQARCSGVTLVCGGVVWFGVVWWCGVVWCGVVWCGVVWCGVVWCGVVWCGVVWCGDTVVW